MDLRGAPMWVDKLRLIPLRFIPQNKLKEARLCEDCFDEYNYEIETPLNFGQYDYVAEMKAKGEEE